MPKVNTNREKWVVKNTTRFPIIIGDLPKVPAIRTGKILNLLRYATKQEIGQSKVLVDLLRARKLTLKKSVQNVAKENVTKDKARESVTSVEKEELEATVLAYNELVELREWLDNVILGDNGGLDLGSGNLTTTGTITGGILTINGPLGSGGASFLWDDKNQIFSIETKNPSSATIQIPELAEVARSAMLQEDAVVIPIPLSAWRQTGNMEQLPAAGDGTNIGFIPGAFATNSPYLQPTVTTGATATEYARTQVVLPECYVNAQTVTFRIRMTAQNPGVPGTITIDLRAFESDGQRGISADLCDTAQQSYVEAWVDYDFVITPTDLVVGDVLDLEIKVVNQESLGFDPLYTWIGRTSLLIDIKG